MDGKVGCFLEHLNTDTLGGWDTCETIVQSMKAFQRKCVMPLPFLTSMIWDKLKNIKRGLTDIMFDPCSEFLLLQ